MKQSRSFSVSAKRARQVLSLCVPGLVAVAYPLAAAVLPEDRADGLYHSYDGGGIEINGPSLLARKQIGNSVSVMGNYYVDSISSASIDVVTTASPYEEKRTEKTVGVDYLRNKTTLSTAFTTSSENDFDAKTAHFTMSQDVFGDLTTVSLGYSWGDDEVGKTGDPAFAETAKRQNYRLNLSQIVTKNLILNGGVEIITDEGFLNNPYRTVRYVDALAGKGYSYQLENYPNTRTSEAVAISGRYFLEHRAAVHGEYRFFRDTWDIRANTFEVGYTHTRGENWIFDVKYRFYNQSQADFYSDLFPYVDAQNYLARDKELSSFSSHTLGFGVSYEFTPTNWRFVDKSSINFAYDYLTIDYDNFRDLRSDSTVGEEPLYSLSANVVQLYLSIWY